MRSRLSTIWIFVVLNYLYCDVVTLMDRNMLTQFLAGSVGGMEMTQGFLLAADVLMEISIAMVLLARVLPERPNRIANLVAGTITTLVQLATVVTSAPTPYYAFFSALEIAATGYVVWAAWRWRPTSGAPEGILSPRPAAS